MIEEKTSLSHCLNHVPAVSLNRTAVVALALSDTDCSLPKMSKRKLAKVKNPR